MADAIPQSIQVLVITILVGAAAAWGVVEFQIWRRKPILKYEPRRPVPWDWVDLLLVLFIYFFCQATCAALAYRWYGAEEEFAKFAESSQGQVALLASAVAAGLLTFLCTAILVAVRSHANLSDLGFVIRAIPRDTLYGIVAFFAAAPVVYLIQVFFVMIVKIEYDHPLVKAVQERKDPATLWLVVISAVVIAPVVEEFLLRVLFQGWLEKLELISIQPPLSNTSPSAAVYESGAVDGMPGAATDGNIETANSPAGLAGLPLGSVPILVSSLVFALLHISQGAAPVPLFFYALVLGYLYQRTHRIWPSIVAHASLNSVSMLMLLLTPVPK